MRITREAEEGLELKGAGAGAFRRSRNGSRDTDTARLPERSGGRAMGSSEPVLSRRYYATCSACSVPCNEKPRTSGREQDKAGPKQRSNSENGEISRKIRMACNE